MMKKAFTLIEVNLAMLIMAGGILSIVGLYAFGFRENAQSREDVAGAAVADAILSPLVMAISSTNVTWSSFKGEFTYPTDGWAAYLDGNYEVTSDPKTQAKAAFDAVMGEMVGADVDKSSFETVLDNAGCTCALVAHHDEESGVVSLALRVMKRHEGNNAYGTLMSQPLYFAEARFQGVQE